MIVSNTDKLLRAFIDASGYEIEEFKCNDFFKHIPYMNQRISDLEKAYPDCKIICGENNKGFDLYKNSIDYKVTKKEQGKQEVIKRMMTMMKENDISFEDIDHAYNWGSDDNT